jgi:hypothetical protein
VSLFTLHTSNFTPQRSVQHSLGQLYRRLHNLIGYFYCNLKIVLAQSRRAAKVFDLAIELGGGAEAHSPPPHGAVSFGRSQSILFTQGHGDTETDSQQTELKDKT